MSEHPENESKDRPDPSAAGHHEVPLEVLEDDENIPPRPEEWAADEAKDRKAEPADGV